MHSYNYQLFRNIPYCLYAIVSIVVVITPSTYGFGIQSPMSSSSLSRIQEHRIVTLRPTKSTTTTLYLEGWVADMIDDELYRQKHKKEYEAEWMNKNKNSILQTLNDGLTTMFHDDDSQSNFREHIKDIKLAKRNPQQYCADRCIATGNCDIYEDVFDFTPEEVMAFCNDCVLGTDDVDDDVTANAECVIPEHFYDIDDYFNILKP